MPFPAPHRLVTFFGDAYGLRETWQFGLRLADDAPEDTPTGSQMDALNSAAQAYLTAGFCSTHRYLGCKVAPQTVAGKYPDGVNATEKLTSSPVIMGGSSQANYPQISLSVTLTTERSRGRGSKGRFYPPTPGYYPDNTGHIIPGDADGCATRAVTFLEAVNDVGLGTVSVMSALGAGSSLPVTGIRVGRVFDTQRRRRAQLAEEYVTAPLG